MTDRAQARIAELRAHLAECTAAMRGVAGHIAMQPVRLGLEAAAVVGRRNQSSRGGTSGRIGLRPAVLAVTLNDEKRPRPPK